MAKQVQRMPDPPEGCYWEPVDTTDDWGLYVGKQLAGKVMAPEEEGGPWKAWMTPPDLGAGYGSSPKSGKAPTRERAAADLLETVGDDWSAELAALRPKKKEPEPEAAPDQRFRQLVELATVEKRSEPGRFRTHDYVVMALMFGAAFALGVGVSGGWWATKASWSSADTVPPACLVSEHPLPWAAWSVEHMPSGTWACAPTPESEEIFCVRMLPASAEKCRDWSKEHIRQADEVDKRERRK